jgi:TatD DNase family protein
MRLAEELGLPVVIHDRDAHADVLQIVRKFAERVSGVMHCYSGSTEMADEVVKLGYHVSLAGPVTFPNARRLHQVVERVPVESIVLETDCPWLTPQSRRGKRNEPALIFETADKVAQLKQMPSNEMGEITSRNAKRLFKIA